MLYLFLQKREKLEHLIFSNTPTFIIEPKDTERQTGKPAWRILFVQKEMPPPQTFPDNQTTFSPAA
ncbi:MAG: hypothetical protein ACOX5F_07430 [Anaerovoracaceae bacterium]|jgi:hypothetical protein